MSRRKTHRTTLPKVDSRGHVRLPPDVMAQAGLKPGDLVRIEAVEGGVLVSKSPLIETDDGLLVVAGEPSERFAEELERIKQEDLDRDVRGWRRT